MPVAGVLLAAVGERSAPARATDGRPFLLVLRALGLGDLLTAVPALRALRDAFPDHRIVLAAPAALAPLAHRSGAVDEVIDTAPLAPLVESLGGADVAVNLHGRGPQSHRVLIAARPRRMISFAHEEVAESRDGPEWRPGEHEVERWCRLLEESGVPADPARMNLPSPDGARAPTAAACGPTVIHPGAASPARRWPAERFAAVARAEREAGREVVLTGSRSERVLAESVAHDAGLPAGAVLAGETDLLGLATLVRDAARVVCGDTGVAHLATALGTASVVLFGPVSPDEWGPPPSRRDRHRVLWAGGTGDPHGSETDAGLLEIGVADVLCALRGLPGTAAGRAAA